MPLLAKNKAASDGPVASILSAQVTRGEIPQVLRGGGTLEKPVGLVYIGCYVNENVTVKKCLFTGNREKNRDSSVVQALTLLRSELLK